MAIFKAWWVDVRLVGIRARHGRIRLYGGVGVGRGVAGGLAVLMIALAGCGTASREMAFTGAMMAGQPWASGGHCFSSLARVSSSMETRDCMRALASPGCIGFVLGPCRAFTSSQLR